MDRVSRHHRMDGRRSPPQHGDAGKHTCGKIPLAAFPHRSGRRSQRRRCHAESRRPSAQSQSQRPALELAGRLHLHGRRRPLSAAETTSRKVTPTISPAIPTAPASASARRSISHTMPASCSISISPRCSTPRVRSRLKRTAAATHSREGDPIAAALVANLPGAFRVHRIASSAPVVRNAAARHAHRSAGELHAVSFHHEPHFPDARSAARQSAHRGTRHSRRKTLPRKGPLPRRHHLLRHLPSGRCRIHRPPRLSATASTARRATATPCRSSTSHGNASSSGTAAPRPCASKCSCRSQDHREMDESLDRVCEKLTASPDYPPLFQAAFRSPGITAEKIALALEQFLLTLSARDSRFDRAMSGKATLTEEEQRGFELFMTEYEPRTGQYGADCFHCHGGALFSDHQFHNNGLDWRRPGRAKVTELRRGRAQVLHSQPAQHRPHRALHARWPLRHAGGSRRALQQRHPTQRRRSIPTSPNIPRTA